MKEDNCVFIVNKGYHDFSPAEAFGEIVYISEDPAGISSFKTSSMARLFQPYIDNSKETDYILVTALTVMVAVLSGMFANRHGRLNLLIYNPTDRKYEAREIVMRGGEDVSNEPE